MPLCDENECLSYTDAAHWSLKRRTEIQAFILWLQIPQGEHQAWWPQFKPWIYLKFKVITNVAVVCSKYIGAFGCTTERLIA